MQGYIIDLKVVKDDDLIVTLLCENELITSYRFYGARHSNINIGYKIDFELEKTKSSIPRLKDVIQLGFPWILNNQKMYAWQRYLKLFYPHLKELEDLEPFYFFLLDNLVSKIEKQNVLRAILESYLLLLDHEGRLHTDFECLICEIKINSNLSIIRGFLPVHKECIRGKVFDYKKIKEFFLTKKSINLNDNEVENLFEVLLLGL
ncbi:recombination protein RecO [Aliarcobacter cibarius]|uniref:Putative RecO family recombination protein n=1 Tax=Aliarcobacter cibarius TaxID=255507 RepID=A0A7L5JR09_9BACT|nr:recombination protein RecO [Aliarcobacter cibarius]QKJ27526.1 putative RecO family recombination protein [Aliarcobacter cibarius]TLT04415.1 recombination protein RecO [Aliarcobacter cibarius]